MYRANHGMLMAAAMLAGAFDSPINLDEQEQPRGKRLPRLKTTHCQQSESAEESRRRKKRARKARKSGR